MCQWRKKGFFDIYKNGSLVVWFLVVCGINLVVPLILIRVGGTMLLESDGSGPWKTYMSVVTH